MDRQERRIANSSEILTLSPCPNGLRAQFRAADDKLVEGRLACRLMFYKDERNNMDPFSLIDRLTHEAKHEREPLEFFTSAERTVVLHDGEGDP
jgi:hypothetical protein